MHATSTLLLVTLPNIHRFKNKFLTLSNKLFQIWLLTTPSHLKYVATLPCNLSLMACFADINISQGSLATYARCRGSFNIHLTTKLFRNFPVKNCEKSVHIWLNYGHEPVAPLFGPPCRSFREMTILEGACRAAGPLLRAENMQRWLCSADTALCQIT